MTSAIRPILHRMSHAIPALALLPLLILVLLTVSCNAPASQDSADTHSHDGDEHSHGDDEGEHSHGHPEDADHEHDGHASDHVHTEDHSHGGRGSSEPVEFTLEQQEQTPFAIELTGRGSLQVSVRGPGILEPAAGGEIVLTAPVSGVVAAPRGAGWPYRGASVRQGGAVVRVTPRSGDDASLARREAEVREVEAELEVARRRLTRLSELLDLEAVARREVEEAEARVAALEARADAARRDLASTRAVRQTENRGEEDDGRTVRVPAERVEVRAPWPGRVAAVAVTPGEAVEAGTELARLVRTRPLWLEVSLSPAEAAQLTGDPAGLLLTLPGREEPQTVQGARRIAESPEVDPVTGTVAVLLEIPEPGDQLTIGAAVDATILLPETLQGLVIPVSALVDDGGTPVVYVQIDDVHFVRHPVTVQVRQGDRILVTGLSLGERLVTRGGAAIRRSTLMTSGGDHGHIH